MTQHEQMLRALDTLREWTDRIEARLPPEGERAPIDGILMAEITEARRVIDRALRQGDYAPDMTHPGIRTEAYIEAQCYGLAASLVADRRRVIEEFAALRDRITTGN